MKDKRKRKKDEIQLYKYIEKMKKMERREDALNGQENN